MRFISLGNDNPSILKYNLTRLAELYPQSEVVLYDWGHKPADLAAFKLANPRLELRPWQAHPGDYMIQKVACIQDAFTRQADLPLVYLDADVILMGKLDLFPADGWDIAATWRPDTGAMREVFGVGTWLNDGVVFINNERAKSSLRFLQAWLERVKARPEYNFWISQAELIRLFSEAVPDLSAGPDLDGLLHLEDEPVRLRTLDGAVYNHLPEPYLPPYPRQASPHRVIHLKSGWRKAKFRMAPGGMKTAWLGWVASDYARRPVLRRLNYGFNAVLRYLLAKGIWPD